MVILRKRLGGFCASIRLNSFPRKSIADLYQVVFRCLLYYFQNKSPLLQLFVTGVILLTNEAWTRQELGLVRSGASQFAS